MSSQLGHERLEPASGVAPRARRSAPEAMGIPFEPAAADAAQAGLAGMAGALACLSDALVTSHSPSSVLHGRLRSGSHGQRLWLLPPSPCLLAAHTAPTCG